MTEAEAKKIGSRQALISVGMGLLAAQLIMTFFITGEGSYRKNFFWFTTFDYPYILCTGIVITLLSAHLYGQVAGRAILIKNNNAIMSGCLCAIAVLVTSALLSAWPGFWQEGRHYLGTGQNPWVDYILKPFYWLTLVGFVPALLIGAWCGLQIKRSGASLVHSA